MCIRDRVWTEPHSRRIKLRLKVQKEVQTKTLLEQQFLVEFTVHYTQCDDCKKDYTPHTWGAVVQIRQKVNHKKTFYFLEQLILKHNAHDKVLNVKEVNGGLDFFFKNKSHAMRLTDFLQSVVPVKIKTAKQLISQDFKNNVCNYKYTYSLELPKICKDDLVIIPQKLAKQFGGTSMILLCYKVTTVIHLIDPITCKNVDISQTLYFQHETDYYIIPPKQNAKEFQVLSIESDSKTSLNASFSNPTKYKLADVQVARVSDWSTIYIKTHLGNILKEGDSALGYDFMSLQLRDDEDLSKQLKHAQDAILYRKHYGEKKKNSRRVWKLKRMDIEDGEEDKKKKKGKKIEEEDDEQDYEEFLDDVERNPEVWKNIDVYWDGTSTEKLPIEKKKEEGKDAEGTTSKRRVVVVKRDDEQKAEAAKQELIQKLQEQEHLDEDELRLQEMLNDLKIADDDPGNENEDVIEQFIKGMDNLKIEK
eukprot:TRINITY_DN449_c0_g1_i6.p1 TRINITY_DN449_c0_g1~~TRINITY_DN449_c0_g1_i6.p1  ORF type:complete len:476 (+),score=131.75 TRINITY_DN449_c0_g1_i6:66-1493(+)